MAKKNETRDAGATGAVLDPDAAKTLSGTRGVNRTGIKTSADMALDLIREAQRMPASEEKGREALVAYRRSYVGGEAPVGSLPEADPDMAPDGLAAADGAASRLLDKLGERLAFERRGVRLYEALVGKVRILGEEAEGPSGEDLEEILADERAHFRLLQEAIVEAGGDPTVMTPSADIAGILSEGAVQVVADPRTTVTQCLQALLAAELADNDGWELLRDLVASLGAEELAARFEEAREREEEHLERVRAWLAARVIGSAAMTGLVGVPQPGSAPARGGRKAAAAEAEEMPEASARPAKAGKPAGSGAKGGGIKAAAAPAKAGRKPAAKPASRSPAKSAPKPAPKAAAGAKSAAKAGAKRAAKPAASRTTARGAKAKAGSKGKGIGGSKGKTRARSAGR